MTVAVKRLRPRDTRDGQDSAGTDSLKCLYREIRIWQRLEHPHILPLLGICHTITSFESIHVSIEHPDPMTSIGIVCPWMENGTLVDFLKLRQKKLENMEELRLRLLISSVVHSKNIIHGDLHGGNVLVDSGGCVRLADFGLSAVVAEYRGKSRSGKGTVSSHHGGAFRWAAPELVVVQEGAEPRLHPSADMYSAGGLILQAYTGKIPYPYYNDVLSALAINAGKKPRRPTSDEANISNALWSVIEECWRDDPLQRPTAAALESRLQVIYSGLGGEQA
ncbi:kinase-like domain-containing protein [Armillaria borealis]|uniref:Kinase-like domain-containing protein n=1 Tax=Armillaria borealis TaxID=47425 RepID=A0AA39MJP9_9AGAR|nr:kinase-like domain-containing protein [Armillaria borealis]